LRQDRLDRWQLPVLAEDFLMPENVMAAARSNWSAERSALVAESLRRGGLGRPVRLQVYGESMLPTLWPGDVVEIASCSLEDIRAGEIVLAMRDGRFFLHRLVRHCLGAPGTPNGFLLCGDSMPGPDPVFPPEALLGRLVRNTGEGRAASAAAVRPGLGASWFSIKFSRTVGMLLCHCGMARRAALKLHRRRKASALQFQDSEAAADIRTAVLYSSKPGPF
jgi:hypothetical protein